MTTNVHPAPASVLRRPSGAFSEWLPVLLGLAVLYVPTLYGLATTLWQQDDHVDGPIILLTMLWVIYQNRHVLVVEPSFAGTRAAPAAGFVILVFGLLMYALGRSQDIIIFEVGSFLPVFAGTLLALRGWSAVRAFWFPLLFVVFLIPLPGFVVDALTGPLKQHVSQVAEQLLYIAGYPIARAGVILNVGQYQLLVADACSGLNSMFSLTAIGILYLYLMKYKSWLHNSIILVSLLPIAFCANIVRVLALVLITYHFGDAAGQGFAHGAAGMLLFVVAVIGVVSLDGILRLSALVLNRGRG